METGVETGPGLIGVDAGRAGPGRVVPVAWRGAAPFAATPLTEREPLGGWLPVDGREPFDGREPAGG
jgi:hypothetical protein